MNENQTTYEKVEFLTQKQFLEYYHKFPTIIQNSIDKDKRGELKPVSAEQLKKKSTDYLNSKPIVTPENDDNRDTENCECED